MCAEGRAKALRYIRDHPGCTMDEMAAAGAIVAGPHGRGDVRSLAQRGQVKGENDYSGGVMSRPTRWYPKD